MSKQLSRHPSSFSTIYHNYLTVISPINFLYFSPDGPSDVEKITDDLISRISELKIDEMMSEACQAWLSQLSQLRNLRWETK